MLKLSFLPSLLNLLRVGLVVELVGLEKYRRIFCLCQDCHYVLLGSLDFAFVHEVVKGTQNVKANCVLHVFVSVEDGHEHVNES